MTNSTNNSSSSSSTPSSSNCQYTPTPEQCDPLPSPTTSSLDSLATNTSLISSALSSLTSTSAHPSSSSSSVPPPSVSSSPAPTANSRADAVEGQHAQTGLGGGAIAGIVLGSATLLCIGGVLLYKARAWSKRGSDKGKYARGAALREVWVSSPAPLWIVTDTGRDGWSESTQYLGAFGWEKDEHEDMDDDSIGIAL